MGFAFKKNLFIYGFFEYQDLHGNNHQSHFGVRYVPAKFLDTGRYSLPYCIARVKVRETPAEIM